MKAAFENSTGMFSPVTLNQEWPTLGRLVFMVICATLGTFLNGFFVAAFFVERALKRVGNVYLACVGLADLIVTALVMPISAVVLLSGQWDILPVCRTLQFLTEVSTYSYSLLFALVAGETYSRLCCQKTEYEMYLSLNSSWISCVVFIFSTIMASVGVYMELDYDYCQRLHRGNYFFRATTLGLLHILPCFMTIYGLFSAAFFINRRARTQNHYRRSKQYDRDYSTTNLNILAYLIYVTAWIPYLVVVHEYPKSNDAKYYHAVWIGVMRSVFTSSLYSTINKNFRRAFEQLFYYCCCKSSLTGSLVHHHRRVLEYKVATGDVRVHIMHQAVSTSSPQRTTTAKRETQEL